MGGREEFEWYIDFPHFVSWTTSVTNWRLEWEIFPGNTALELVDEVRKMIEKKLIIEPENFWGPHHLHVHVQRQRLVGKGQ